MTLRDTQKYDTFKAVFQEELLMFKAGLLDRLSTNEEWARALSIRKWTITGYLKTAVLEGLVSNEDLIMRKHQTKSRPPQVNQAIKEMLEEIKAYQASEIQTLKGNEYYAQKAGLTTSSFSALIRYRLPREILDYRTSELSKQRVQRKWQNRHLNIAKVVESVPEEIEAYRQGLIERLRTNGELAQLAGINNIGQISDELKKLVSQGKLTTADRKYRAQQLRLFANSNRDLTNFIEMGRIMSEARKGEKNGPLSEETKRNMSEAHIGLRHSESSKEKMRIFAIKNRNGDMLVQYKQNMYEFQGHTYASKTECATARALEKYIPGYKIIEGETFQLHKDTNYWFDFLLPGTGKIIEWHPIDWRYDGKKLLPFDFGVLQEKEQKANNGDRDTISLIKTCLKEDLTFEYWKQRQEAANNSQDYRGNEVIVVRTPGELYDLVISEYGEQERIPLRSDFVKEFNELTKKAKPIKNNLIF